MASVCAELLHVIIEERGRVESKGNRTVTANSDPRFNPRQKASAVEDTVGAIVDNNDDRRLEKGNVHKKYNH